MNTRRTFWLVWNVGGGVPIVQHRSLDSAIGEAKRLAAAHPGQEFAVMESVAIARKVDVVIEQCHEDASEDIPF